MAWSYKAVETPLWRTRTSWRGHSFAWTQGDGSPADDPAIALTADEAARSQFALARQLAVPTVIICRQEGDDLLLETPWLPRPEYRWLTLHAVLESDPSGPSLWRLPASLRSVVLDELQERLGIVVEES